MSSQQSNQLSRTERRQEKTKKKIITATIQLIAEHGYDDTTMELIAETADIAKGTLYKYFPVKEAIISAFIQQSFSEGYTQRIQEIQKLPDTRSRMLYVFKTLIGGIQAQTILFEKYLVYRMQRMASLQHDDDEKSGLYLLGAEIINLGQESGEIRQDIPAVILQELFEFVFMEVVKQLYLSAEVIDLDSISDSCVDLFLKGTQRTS